MDKWNLIELTLDQLIEQWERNKEQFDIDVSDDDIYSDNRWNEASILWCPISMSDSSEDSKADTESNSMRKGVVITYRHRNEFRCRIFKISDLTSKMANSNIPAENSISARRYFVPFRSLYRKFMKLRGDIIAYKRQKANSSYMSNLCGMFPGTMDDHIIGSYDDEDK